MTADNEKEEAPQKRAAGGPSAAASLGAHGREDAHKFFTWELTLIVSEDVDPEVKKLAKAGFLTLVEDPTHYLYQPRADWGVDEDLVRSIAPKPEGEGQLHNLRIQRDGPDKLTVIGRGRLKAAAMRSYRACKAAGVKLADLSEEKRDELCQKVTASVIRGSSQEAWRAMQAENSHRNDSNPLEKAKEAERGIALGLPKKLVAKLAMRVDVPTMDIKMQILDLAPEVQDAIVSGELAEWLALREYTKWTKKKQVEHLEEMRAAGMLKGADAEAAVEQINKGAKPEKSAEQGKRAPSRKMVLGWADALKGMNGVWAEAMRAGFMMATGGQPKGIPPEIKKRLKGDD